MNGRYKSTPHLALPLYTDDTPMDLRDGYNHAMEILDKETRRLETLIREMNAGNK